MLKFDNIVITPEMMRQINEIDAFKFAWQQHNWAEQYHLPQATIFDYVEPQNVVITEPTDNAIMEKFFTHIYSRLKDLKELDNYAVLLSDIYTNYQHITLNEKTVKQIHKRLFYGTKMKQEFLGQYKTTTNHLTVYDKYRRKVTNCFEPATPENTPRLMNELMEWTNLNLHQGSLHPLIVIGLFADYFLAIHPFYEGNGRITRALIVLLMLKTGYNYVAYTSLDTIVKASLTSYYRSLWLTNMTIWDSQPNFTPWLSFFIAVLYKQKHHLENILSQNRMDGIH